MVAGCHGYQIFSMLLNDLVWVTLGKFIQETLFTPNEDRDSLELVEQRQSTLNLRHALGFEVNIYFIAVKTRPCLLMKHTGARQTTSSCPSLPLTLREAGAGTTSPAKSRELGLFPDVTELVQTSECLTSVRFVPKRGKNAAVPAHVLCVFTSPPGSVVV